MRAVLLNTSEIYRDLVIGGGRRQEVCLKCAIKQGWSCQPSLLVFAGPRELESWAITDGGNLGDETVVAILIHKIREHYPDAEIVGFSLNPEDTERRHGIKAFPIRLQSELSRRRRPPRVSRVDVKPNLFIRLKQLLKKFPIIFKPLKCLKNCLCDLPWAVLGELSFLRRSFHRLRGFDILVVPGSGPLTDWWDAGPWEHPYSFLVGSCSPE